jgi:hypothetical protein
MTIRIIEVHDLGDDRLRVRAHVDGSEDPVRDDDGQITGSAPRVCEAFGWMSAMARHYDADAYQDDGHRCVAPGHGKARHHCKEPEPRPMTDDERRAYWERLVREQHPEIAEAPAPTLLFAAPSRTIEA